MCKFHDTPLISLAYDKETAEIDPVRWSILKVALAAQQGSQYFPDVPGLSGNATYLMAMPDMQQVFHESSLPQQRDEINTINDETGALLDQALTKLITEDHLTETSLNLPPSEKGHRRVLRRFVAGVMDDSYQEMITTDRYPLKQGVSKPEHKPLFDATKKFLEKPGVEQALEKRFQASVGETFLDAPELAKKTKFDQAMFWAHKNVPKTYIPDVQRCAETVCTSGLSFLYCKLSCALMPGAVALAFSKAAPALMANPAMMWGSMLLGPAIGYGASELYYKHKDIDPSPSDKKWRERGIGLAFLASALTMRHGDHAHGVAHDMPDHGKDIVCRVPKNLTADSLAGMPRDSVIFKQKL